MGARVAASKGVMPGLLRCVTGRAAIVATVDYVLNPRTHFRHTAEALRRELARLAADPTTADRRTTELQAELRLVEAELAQLERPHRRQSAGR
jgi:chromosome segregation ATPase